jgi:elongation factor 3
MMDKGQPVRSAIQSAVNALIKICPPESTRQVLEILGTTLNDVKGWRSKVAALKAMEGMVRPGEDGEWVALEFGHIIPTVEHAMHDTKSEVRIVCFNKLTSGQGRYRPLLHSPQR